MVVGRPRTVSLPKKEMIELGKEMVKWVEEHQPLHLTEWYSIEKMIDYHVFKNYCDMPEFSPYYNKALAIISKNYINGNIAPPIAQRFLRGYFKDLRHKEDEELQTKLDKELIQKMKLAEHQSKLNKDEQYAISETDQKRFDNILNQIQSAQSALKIAQSNNSTDTKSE